MATVKLQDREIKKLKITVTNIKSVLLEKQKELNKVKLSKKRLDNAALQLARKEGKEKSVEAVKKSSPLTSFSKKAGAATGNIIDKILYSRGKFLFIILYLFSDRISRNLKNNVINTCQQSSKFIYIYLLTTTDTEIVPKLL